MPSVAFGTRMLLGYETNAGEPCPIESDRDFVLCIGSREPLIRFALDALHEKRQFTFIDLDGQYTDELLRHVPHNRWRNIFLFELDWENPPAFNVLTYCPPEQRSAVATSIVQAFNAVWNEDRAPIQVSRWIRLAVLALLETQDATLFKLPYLFTDWYFRQRTIGHITDPVLALRWREYDELPVKDRRPIFEPVLNRLDPLLMDVRVRNSIAQQRSFIDRNAGKSLLVRLPAQELGFETAATLAGLVLSRAPGQIIVPVPFPLPATKNLTLGASYLSEIPKRTLDSLLGKSVIIAFRLSPMDARTLEPTFGIPEQAFQLTDIPDYRAYVRTDKTALLDMPPISQPLRPASPGVIRNRSRNQSGSPKEKVEQEIRKFIE